MLAATLSAMLITSLVLLVVLMVAYLAIYFSLPVVAIGGPKDPEMETIHELAVAHDIEWVYGKRDGRRVKPSTADKVTNVRPRPRQVWIECRPEGGFPWWMRPFVRIIDHHPPDLRSHAPAWLYWWASSLGQFCHRFGIRTTKQLRTVAAADHAPLEAMTGKLDRWWLGKFRVTAEDALNWDIRATVKLRKIPEDQVRAEVRKWRDWIAGTEPVEHEGHVIYVFEGHFEHFWRFLCLRTAFLAEGVPGATYLDITHEGEPATKVHVIGASRGLLKLFKSREIFKPFDIIRIHCIQRRYAIGVGQRTTT